MALVMVFAMTPSMTVFAEDGDPEAVDPITREQFAAILYRYNKMKEDSPISNLQSSISQYTDADEISDWAKEAMDWCVTAGIITGVTDTTLVPKGKSTRAQAATMLMRYCKNN